MQLLKITNVPIKYEYEVERARLEMKSKQPGYDIERERAKLNLRSQNIQVRIDTKDARASMGLYGSGTFAQEMGERGLQAVNQAKGEAAQFGNQMAQTADGVTIAQIVTQKMMTQPTSYTTFLPSVGPSLMWEPNKLDTSFDPGSVKFDWKIMKNSMDYIPGKFSMNILQYPRVSIEYMGEPNYVPPSANPSYQEEIA